MAWRDNELAAQAAETLGEPDRVFHVSPARSIAIGAIGFLLALWGIVGSILWFAVLNAGAKVLKGYFILVLAPAGIGLTMLYRIVRTRGLTVLTYPTGILVVNRGDVFSFPWDEIVDIRLGNVNDLVIEHDEAGQITSLVLPGMNTTWFGGSNTLTLTTSDGRIGQIPVAVPGFKELTIRVQKETAERLWPITVAKFQAGETIAFGPFIVLRDRLIRDSKEIFWSDLGQVKVSMTNLVVRKKAGMFKDWQNLPVAEVANPHLFVRFVKTMIDDAESLLNSPEADVSES
jgi:hypothetical protein